MLLYLCLYNRAYEYMSKKYSGEDIVRWDWLKFVSFKYKKIFIRKTFFENSAQQLDARVRKRPEGAFWFPC